MFAYCGNNPTSRFDPTGNLWDWIEDIQQWFDENIVEPIKKVAGGLQKDIANFDIENTSEQTVLKSNYFSFYRGVPVFRFEGDRSGSFGAIFLTYETNDREHPEDMVRHEYGHTVQLKELGLINYALCIAIPSAEEWGHGEYYSKPWELSADMYGHVLYRNHSKEDYMAAFKYLDDCNRYGIFMWLTID